MATAPSPQFIVRSIPTGGLREDRRDTCACGFLDLAISNLSPVAPLTAVRRRAPIDDVGKSLNDPR